MATVGVLALAATAISPAGAWEALTYQVDRPVQVQSSPAVALYALDALGAGEAVRVASNRSDGLLHPASAAVSAALLAVLCGIVALLSLQAARDPGDPRRLVIAALGAVTAFVCLGRVLSPQYLLWVLPLGALALAWGRYALAATVAAAVVLTQVEFPAHYFDLLDREPWVVAVVALRDATLVAVVALAVRELGAPAPVRAGSELGREEHLLDRGGAAVGAGLH